MICLIGVKLNNITHHLLQVRGKNVEHSITMNFLSKTVKYIINANINYEPLCVIIYVTSLWPLKTSIFEYRIKTLVAQAPRGFNLRNLNMEWVAMNFGCTRVLYCMLMDWILMWYCFFFTLMVLLLLSVEYV